MEWLALYAQMKVIGMFASIGVFVVILLGYIIWVIFWFVKHLIRMKGKKNGKS